MTCLVIPVADSTPESEPCLDSLLWSIESQGIHNSYSVIVCFDRLNGLNFAEQFITKYKWIDPIINEGNRLNFARNSNRGLRKAFNEYKDSAIVVNQDTMIPSKQYLDQISGEGIVSPQQITLEGTKEQILEQMNHQNSLQPNPPERASHKKVVAFFLYINYQVMKKIGYWDSRFVTFEDDDYSLRTIMGGFPVETVSTQIHHGVSKCGQYDNERLQLNFAKFKYKWSISDTVSHLDCADWVLNQHSFCEEMRCD